MTRIVPFEMVDAALADTGAVQQRALTRRSRADHAGGTIETWWPAIEVALATGLTNARTEGTDRLIKQVKRAACGFRNRDNYRRRVRLHCTRQTR